MASKQKDGFTLIELILVIAIIMVLTSVVLVSLNLNKQFKSAREAQRIANVGVILDSLTQYAIDQKGKSAIPNDNISRYISEGVHKPIGSAFDSPVPQPNIALCELLVPKYMAQIPIDPLMSSTSSQGIDAGNCSNYHTGYMVTGTLEGRIIVSAPFSEVGPIIAVR